MQAEPGRYLVLVLCLIATTGQAGSFLYLPALPTLAAEFGTGEAGAQMTLTAYLLGTCLGFAVYGQIADAFGHRRVFWVAGVVFVAASAAGALVQDLASLNVVRFVQGAGSVAGIITARSSIRTLVPPSRAPQAMAALTAVVALAPAASPVIGALVLDVTGWRATFWLAALMGIGAIAAGWAVLPRGVRIAAQDRPRHAVRSLLGSRTFLACVLIGSTCNSAFMILMAGSPFVFIGIFGLSEIAYTGLLSAMLVAFAAAALWSGHLVARLGARRVLGWAMVPVISCSAGLVTVALLEPGLWPFYLVLALMIGSMGLVVPTGHTIMLAPFPEIAGTAVGVAMLVNTIAGALALAAYGLLVSGSVTGFGLSIAGFTALILAGWASLPRAGGTPG
jgi:DHA1 family bicyclomycin/chloramphenicol resistance-like MFS transporter